MKKSTRIYFSVWGKGVGKLNVPAYAMKKSGESRIDAVVGSFEQMNGLYCCGGPRSEGVEVDRHGEERSFHYAFTLCKKVKGGGGYPVAEVWIALEA